MNWLPPAGSRLLAPFDHQVAGQSFMLRYDESTVCKPLIIREHFVYQTLPAVLKEFTPEYRGELEVSVVEKDDNLQLYGLCVKDSNEDLCQCSLQGTRCEDLSGPDAPPEKDFDGKLSVQSIPNVGPDLADQNRCVISILRRGNYEIFSSTNDKRMSQLSSKPNTQEAEPLGLNPWSCKNHQKLLDKIRKGKHGHNCFYCILLKNVVADLRHPCILDIKIGSRLHGDQASPEKIELQCRRSSETTSNSLGVRLCGMQVYQKDSGQNINLDKFQGRLLTDETFKKTLCGFLHNGVRYRSELLQPIITKLSSLIECLRTVNTYRFFTSSLLIIYDGLEKGMGEELNETSKVGMSDYHEEQCSRHANKHNSLSPSSISWDQRNVNSHVETPYDVQKNYNNTHNVNQPSLPMSFHLECGKDCVHNPTQPIAHNSTNCSFSTGTSVSQHNFDCGAECTPEKCLDSFQTLYKNSGAQNFTFKHSEYQLESTTLNNVFNHSSATKNRQSVSPLWPEQNTSDAQILKVDVKMIDFAHTTHQGFPNDKCQHEGPDMDYIQGLTNLMTLFQTLMDELEVKEFTQNGNDL